MTLNKETLSISGMISEFLIEQEISVMPALDAHR